LIHFNYIRHPIYVGVILSCVGAELVARSYLFIVFLAFISLMSYIQSKKEEQLLVKHFGTAYKNYMQKTNMFVPYIF